MTLTEFIASLGSLYADSNGIGPGALGICSGALSEGNEMSMKSCEVKLVIIRDQFCVKVVFFVRMAPIASIFARKPLVNVALPSFAGPSSC